MHDKTRCPHGQDGGACSFCNPPPEEDRLFSLLRAFVGGGIAAQRAVDAVLAERDRC